MAGHTPGRENELINKWKWNVAPEAMIESRTDLIQTILLRLKAAEWRSFDHYDFWGSRAGIFLRRTKSPLTLPLIGAAFVADNVFPRLFRSERHKRIPMETLPAVMNAMRVYAQMTGDNGFEADRAALLRTMIGSLGSSPHGRGVGHAFDWYTTVLIPAGTPCAPLTTYLVDYLLAGHPEAHPDVLRDAGEFVYRDLHMEEKDGIAWVSYTPLDRRRIINANAYAARILSKLGRHFSLPHYTAAAEKILNYVLSMQEPEGGWWYFDRTTVREKDNFIDCFHSAFVLATLLEWADEGHTGAGAALDQGLAWFMRVFIGEAGAVRHFAKSHLPIRITADIRSCAETINLMARVSRRYPQCLETARTILKESLARMYDGAGGFYFRKYGFYTCRMNYARWGAAPMLGALAQLAIAEGAQ